MAVIVVKFATPVAKYNFLGGAHLQVQSKSILQLPVGFATIAAFSFFSALFG